MRCDACSRTTHGECTCEERFIKFLKCWHRAHSAAKLSDEIAAGSSDFESDSGLAQHLNFICSHILSSAPHLLHAAERNTLQTLLSLRKSEIELAARLSQRKGSWFRIDQLIQKYEQRFEPIVADVQAALHSLIASGLACYVDTSCTEGKDAHFPQGSELANLAEVLVHRQRKEIVDSLRLFPGEQAPVTASALLERIKQHAQSAPECERNRLLESIVSASGSSMRLRDALQSAIEASCTAFFHRPQCSLSALSATMGKFLRYPRADVTPSTPVFPSRSALDDFSEAFKVRKWCETSWAYDLSTIAGSRLLV
jgi:hypothetical protein